MSTGARVGQRDLYLAEADSLTRKKTEFTKEDKARVDSLIALADACGEDGMRMRRARLTQIALSSGQQRRSEYESDSKIETEFRDYLIRGKDAIAESRDQSITTDSAGGYVVPASFRDMIEVALRAYDGLYDVCGVWQSKTGTASNVPILNDVNNAATIVSENGTSNYTDIDKFDALAFDKTPTWRTGIVRVSRELSQDSYFDLATKLADAFAVRLARGISPALISALISNADTGKTTAIATAVTAAELLDLMGSLDSAYWGNSNWLMNKNTLIALLKLGMVSDAAGQAYTMWSPNRDFYLFTRPVRICPSMADIGANNVPISFGDHSKVLRREVVGSLSVREYNERFAEYYQFGYEGFWRVDTGFLKPSAYGSPAVSASPCKLLACHS